MMNVLWLSGNSAMYANQNSYNGGGWIYTLQQHIQMSGDVQLSMAFPWNVDFEESGKNCTYYGIKRHRFYLINKKSKENKIKNRLCYIINKVKPDIIHVWGTEEFLGLACEITDIPVVIHLQGILGPIYNAWLPSGLSWLRLYFLSPKYIYIRSIYKYFICREKIMMQKCSYFIGRTDWDKSISKFISPKSQYFYCSEMLRTEIYDSTEIWKYKKNRKSRIIISIISSGIYKGGDVILKVAKLLKKYSDTSYEWHVYGISTLKDFEKIAHINSEEVNVIPKGIINAQQLVEKILDADIFAHFSYIENSSNAVCEAQLLGIPVIATDVGGMSSLINNNVNGVLVPSNDSYIMSSTINSIISDENISMSLGHEGHKIALERHNPDTITNDLLLIYNSIINNKNRGVL